MKVLRIALFALAGGITIALCVIPVAEFEVEMVLDTTAVQFTLDRPAELGQFPTSRVTFYGVRELELPPELAEHSVASAISGLPTRSSELSVEASSEHAPLGQVDLAPFELDAATELDVSSAADEPRFVLAIAGNSESELRVVMRHTVTVRTTAQEFLDVDVGSALPEIAATMSKHFKVSAISSATDIDVLSGAVQVSSLRFSRPRESGGQPQRESSIRGGRISITDFKESFALDGGEGWVVRTVGTRGDLRLAKMASGGLRATFHGTVHRLALGRTAATVHDRTPVLAQHVAIKAAMMVAALAAVFKLLRSVLTFFEAKRES